MIVDNFQEYEEFLNWKKDHPFDPMSKPKLQKFIGEFASGQVDKEIDVDVEKDDDESHKNDEVEKELKDLRKDDESFLQLKSRKLVIKNPSTHKK